MNHFISVLIAIILFLSSCTVEEEYSFNNDWSGVYQGVIDVSLIAEMGDSGKDMIPEDEVKEMEDKLNSYEGISNAFVKQNMDNHTISFGYSFQDLESLNHLNQSDLDEDNEDSMLSATGNWVMKSKGKKKFMMTMTPLKKAENDEFTKGEDGDIIQFKSIFTFFGKVKKLNSEVAVRGEKDNQIIIEYSLGDMWDMDKDWNVEVKL